MAGGRVSRGKKGAPKMSGLVVAALRNLRDAHGSTAKEIMKYIMAEYNASETTVQRQLRTALKRGVEYGILKKTNAGYSLNTDAEVIGPLDLAQMDACRKKKRMSCRPKRRPCCPKPRRRCPPKCPRRRKKKPCGTCASRGRRSDCSKPVTLVHEGTPTLEEDSSSRQDEQDPEKQSVDGDVERQRQGSRSRSNSKGMKGGGNRSRSQSLANSRYSGSETNDEENQDDE
ncbi:hypothetical protein TKK_0009312 [Trichogramma kaykai]